MPEVSQQDAVIKEIRIEARPETIFQFFVDPEKMLRWKGLTAELDPRPGGIYRVDMNGNDIARGEYVELDPPRRLVFSWGWEGDSNPVPPGSTTVEIDLIPQGGGTLVRLTHSGLPTQESRDMHLEGWAHYVERLGVAAAGGDPGPDPWASGESRHGDDAG